MDDILSLLIADSILATHIEGGEQDESVVRTVVARKVDGNPDERSKGFAKVKAPKVAAPVALAPAAPPPVPTKDTAIAFLVAVRDAGKRPNADGVMVRETKLVRDDEAKALATFVGYSKAMPHGTQLETARRKATALTKDGWAEDKPIRTAPTVGGYVAGAPDPSARLLQDLRAKQRAIIDAACKLEKAGKKADADKLLAASRKFDEQIQAMR